MAARRTLSILLLAITIALLAPPARAELPGWAIDPVVPGVQHLRHERPGTLSVHAARVAPDAGFALRTVVAGNAVGGLPGNPHSGRELTSDLCRRAGGLLCVNGDFFMSPKAGQAAGGLVVDTRPVRSFRPDLSQLSIIDGKLTTAPIGWSGKVTGRVANRPVSFGLASLNRNPIADGISLYTSEWGPQTPPNVPRVELVLAAGGLLGPGKTAVVPVARRQEAGPIPRDAVVLVGTGASAGILNNLWHFWVHAPKGKKGTLAVHSELTAPASLSIGGHPVLIRDGQRLELNRSDPFVLNRHPRTIAGMTAKGELLLVAVDGRQPGHSEGLTLFEAQDLMTELGAVEAINLDGGGSTTFIGRCGADQCVRNRPSGGGQRPVVSALALVPAKAPRRLPKDPVAAASAGGPQVVAAPAAAEPTAVDVPEVDAPVVPDREIAPAVASTSEPQAEVALAPVADVIGADQLPARNGAPNRVPVAIAAALAALAAAAADLQWARRQSTSA